MLVGLAPFRSADTSHSLAVSTGDDDIRSGRIRRRSAAEEAASSADGDSDALERLARQCALTFVPKDAPPSGSGSIKKRGKKSRRKRKHGQTASAEGEPLVTVTTSHSVSVVLSDEGKGRGEDTAPIEESSRWCYQSRPGPSTSFLPPADDELDDVAPVMNGGGKKKTPSKRGKGRKSMPAPEKNLITPLSVPAVFARSSAAAGSSRPSGAFFALRGGNTTLCAWDGEDAAVEGPDHADRSSGGGVWSASLPDGARAVSMEALPSQGTTASDAEMGVCGALSDGTVYVAVLAAGPDSGDEDKPELVIGRFGDPIAAEAILFASPSVAVDANNNGGVAISVLSRSETSPAELKLRRHVLSGLRVTSTSAINPNEAEAVDTDDNNVHLNGKKEKKKRKPKDDTLLLLEGEHGSSIATLSVAVGTDNGDGKAPARIDMGSFKACRLSGGALAVAYRASSAAFDADGGDAGAWFLLGLDPSSRPVHVALSGAVASIAGLSDGIAAVLTRPAAPGKPASLSLYDVHRSALVHSARLTSALLGGGDGADEKARAQPLIAGLASDPSTGTLALLHASPSKKNSGSNAVSLRVSLSKLTMDSVSNNRGGGDYNLATALASSFSLQTSSALAAAQSMKLVSLLAADANIGGSEKDCVTGAIETLGGSVTGFGEAYAEAAVTLTSTSNSAAATKVGGNSALRFGHAPTSLPSRFVRLALPLVVHRLTERKSSDEEREVATRVLLDLLRSGRASVRGGILDADGALRAVLARCSRLHRQRCGAQGEQVPTSVDVIDSLLSSCPDSISERGLVAMARHVLTGASEGEMDAHFVPQREDERMKRARERRDVESARLVELRAKAERAQKTPSKKKRKTPSKKKDQEVEPSAVELMALEEQCRRLSDRLAALRTVSLVGQIAAHSACNGAMLRAALREEGFGAKSEGTEAMLRALSRGLRQTAEGTNASQQQGPTASSRAARIAAWMAAAADVSASQSSTIRAARSAVRDAICQADALTGMDVLLERVRKRLEEETKEENDGGAGGRRGSGGTTRGRRGGGGEGAAVPPYGIERLVF